MVVRPHAADPDTRELVLQVHNQERADIPRSGCLGESAKDPDALLSGVFEFWQRLDRFLGRSGQHELAILLLQLAHWNGNVMPTEADKPARADDHEGDGRVGRNDEIVDLPDPLILLVVDGLTHSLLFDAPAERHRLHLLHRDAESGRSGDLSGGISTGYQNETRQCHDCHALHRRLLMTWNVNLPARGHAPLWGESHSPCQLSRRRNPALSRGSHSQRSSCRTPNPVTSSWHVGSDYRPIADCRIDRRSRSPRSPGAPPAPRLLTPLACQHKLAPPVRVPARWKEPYAVSPVPAREPHKAEALRGVWSPPPPEQR